MASENIKNIHLIAICGTGMASLAGLLKKAGFNVTGSDANIYPPMSTLLEDLNIEIRPGYKKENITDDIDLIVVGNAISKDNEEVLAVQEKGIPYISFPQALAQFFLEGKKSLVVTGTHGKTTTTSLASWVFHHAGRKPGFMVGGWLKNFDANHKYDAGEHFIIEGDEYDTAFFDKGPKFLHYQPHAAILTGIEFDHADIYRDLDHFRSSFEKFVKLIDPEGILLVEASDPIAVEVAQGAPCKVETYGFGSKADWRIAGYNFKDGAGWFTLSHKEQDLGTFKLPMIGRHNVLNAVAVTALAINMGLSADEVADALREFKGIKRRQEVVGTKHGVVVIDDFAHHPTAIKLTLEAVRKAWPHQEIWAIFEPRSATSRRKVFEKELPKSFRGADRTVIAQPFSQDKIDPEDRLDGKQVVRDINDMGAKAVYIPEVDDIVDYVIRFHTAGDIILIMSSGGFGGIHQKILDRL